MISDEHISDKWSQAKQSNSGNKAKEPTSDFPIGFQRGLPAHNDSTRLPFSSNDCQILGSRGRGCEMKQRQGLVIECERKQAFMGLLIMMLTLRIYHAVYRAHFTIYNLFQLFERNKQTNLKIQNLMFFSWKLNDFQRSKYREKRIRVILEEKSITGILKWALLCECRTHYRNKEMHTYFFFFWD